MLIIEKKMKGHVFNDVKTILQKGEWIYCSFLTMLKNLHVTAHLCKNYNITLKRIQDKQIHFWRPL